MAYPFIRPVVEKGEIELYGWFYRIEDGRILTYDRARGEIVEVGSEGAGEWCEKSLLRMAEAEEDLWDKLRLLRKPTHAGTYNPHNWVNMPIPASDVVFKARAEAWSRVTDPC